MANVHSREKVPHCILRDRKPLAINLKFAHKKSPFKEEALNICEEGLSHYANHFFHFHSDRSW